MAEKRTLIPLMQDLHNLDLLLTKLDPPRWHNGLVSRHRLMNQFDRVIKPGITLLNAPAGFGKTLSVAGWLHSRSIKAAWLTLDTADNDPQCFWQYMLTALGRSIPGLKQRLAARYAYNNHFDPELFAASFINELSGKASALTIVLDDIHLIIESKTLAEIAMLIDRLSDLDIRMILIGRHIPSELTRSSKICSRTYSIDSDSLRFDYDEINELLSVQNITLSQQEVRIVESKTEGWAMGLMLGLRTLQQQQSRVGFIEAFKGSSQLMSGFLSDEVFSQWDPSTREFLLKTSVLDRMTIPLCNAVTGRKDSHKILKELSKENTLVIPLNNRKGWYRYHHLLATFLKSRMSEEGIDDFKELNYAAAEYYERNHLMDAAITHYLKGRHYTRAVELIEKTAPQMVRDGKRLVTLKRWLQRIPNDLISGNALLLITEGWVHLLEDRKEEAETAVFKAESLKPMKEIEAELHSLKANLALQNGQFDQAAFMIKKAVDQPHFNNIFKGAAKSLSESEAGLSLLAGRIGFYGNISLFRTDHGWLSERLSDCQYETGGGLDVIQAEIHYELNEIDKAIPILMKGLGDASEENLWSVKLPAMVLLAKVMRAKGDLDGSIIQLRQAADQLKKEGQRQRHHRMQAYLARVEMEAGSQGAAELWLEKNSPDISESTTELNHMEKMIKAIILMHQRKHELASIELLSVKAYMEKECRLIGLAETLNLLAICSLENGNGEAALNYARESVVIGNEQGYTRLYVDEGIRLLPVLKHLQKKMRRDQEDCSDLCEYAASLILEIRKHIKKLPQRKTHQMDNQLDELIEPLTIREMTVLKCLTKEMSNQEISDQLQISISTVKVHTRNIYGKLAVCNRTQAVTTAREMKLV
jgi:LuxR family transcriptional regulator, maltose regulon positive regulatory protein